MSFEDMNPFLGASESPQKQKFSSRVKIYGNSELMLCQINKIVIYDAAGLITVTLMRKYSLLYWDLSSGLNIYVSSSMCKSA